MVVKWNFYDESTDETYEFEVNPNAGGSPVRRKNITQANTVAPGGKTLIFEGAEAPPEIDFSGTILTEDQYDFFVERYETQRQLELTDDLLRIYTVILTEFSPTRVRARSHPWKHTYTCKALIVDWP